MTPILLVPGLGGSGQAHWMTHWEQNYPGCVSVQQDNWNIPDLNLWLERLNEAVRACAKPPFFVAHGVACALIVHWAKRHPDVPIEGAIMVAPSDVDSEEHTSGETRCFSPMPMDRLPFPTTIVASFNDKYVDFGRAKVFASAWGADLISIGECGHINADSFMGGWKEGWEVLNQMKDRELSAFSG